MLGEWLKLALAFSGIKQVELARYLTDRLGRSVDASAVHKMLNGKRKMFADELLLIAHICKYQLPTPFPYDDLPDSEELMRRHVASQKAKKIREKMEADPRSIEEIRNTYIGGTPENFRRIIVFEVAQMDATLTNKQINSAADRILQGLRSDIDAEERTYRQGLQDAD